MHMESRKMVLKTYLQGSNGAADRKSRHVDKEEDGEGGMN